MASDFSNKGKLKPAFERSIATTIASRQMYTASGGPIQNLEAYTAAGGTPYNSAGAIIYNPTAYRNAIEASVRQNTTDPKYLYHYTTSEAADNIASSGTLKSSSDGIAGPGTYCTAKPPRSSNDNLLSNNYGNAAARDPSYVHSYVRMNADDVQATYLGAGRDVWKVDGDVDLGHQNAFVTKRERRTPSSQESHLSSRDLLEYETAASFHGDVAEYETNTQSTGGGYVDYYIDTLLSEYHQEECCDKHDDEFQGYGYSDESHSDSY